jgi:hypothetical protein
LLGSQQQAKGAVANGALRAFGLSVADGLSTGATRRSGYASVMCRNIRTLHNFDPPATDEEVRAAALQYVRKVSGFSKPSRANQPAFERAVDAIAVASSQLLDELHTSAPAKSRELEAARACARAAQRFAA